MDPEMLALLGTDKDAVLAQRWGTTAKTVNLKRNALGIPAFGLVQWTPEMLGPWAPTAMPNWPSAGDEQSQRGGQAQGTRHCLADGKARHGALSGTTRLWLCWAQLQMPKWLRSWG